MGYIYCRYICIYIYTYIYILHMSGALGVLWNVYYTIKRASAREASASSRGAWMALHDAERRVSRTAVRLMVLVIPV